MSYYGNIDSLERKRNTVAMLSGDVKLVEELLKQSNGQPLPISDIQWFDKTYTVDSRQLATAMYDALSYDDYKDLFVSRHVQELLDLHQQLCPAAPRIDYGELEFIKWNDWGNYFDGDETQFLMDDGVRQIDIDLANAGIQHKEKEVISLLKAGASPYFLNRTDINTEVEPSAYGYFEVAPMLSILDSQMCDQWQFYGLSDFREDIQTLSKDSLELVVFCLFQAGAASRILHLVDKYITSSARMKGEAIMKKYHVNSPILKHTPVVDE